MSVKDFVLDKLGSLGLIILETVVCLGSIFVAVWLHKTIGLAGLSIVLAVLIGVPWLIVTLKDDKQESAEDEAKKNVSYKEVEAAMFAEQNGKTSEDVVRDIQQVYKAIRHRGE